MSPGGDAGRTDDEEFELFVRLSSGSRLRLRGNGLAAHSSVAAAKAAIEALLPDAPAGSQRLIYKGRILDDDTSGLDRFGIVHQSTLFLVVSRADEATTSPGSGGTTTSVTNAPTIPATTGTPPSTFAPPTPAAAAPAAPSRSTAPASANLSSDRLQQLLQSAASQPQQPPPPPLAQRRPGFPGSGAAENPGSMEPWMQRLMRDMDPNFLAGVMQTQLESNPALQRLMDENPHLRHMMTDPAALQQAANMLRNPDAMQQAMRQQDLALSQLENMPGGFAALSSMYQNMQAPLEESLAAAPNRPDSTSSATSAPSSQHSDEGAAGTAMPNPWGSSPSGAVGRTPRNPPRGERNPFLEGLLAPRGSPGAPPFPTLPSLSYAPSSRRPGASHNPWANLGAAGSSAGQRGAGPARDAPSMQSSRSAPLGGGGTGGGGDDPLLRAALQLAREHPDQLRELIMSDPAHRAMFGHNMSPEMFNQLLEMALNPNVIEMMRQFEGLRGADPRGFPSPPAAGDLSALMNAALSNPGVAGQPRPVDGAGLDFSSLLQGTMGGAPGNPAGYGGSLGQSRLPSPSPSPSSAANPRDRYRRQLQQLADMGFDHEASCLAALQAEHGNLNRAVDRLLSSPPPAPPAVPQRPSEDAGAASRGPDDASPHATVPSEEPPPPRSSAGGADEPPAPPKDAVDKKND